MTIKLGERGPAPYGYKKDYGAGSIKNNYCVEEAGEQAVIKTMTELQQSGYGLRKIAGELNARGIKPRNGEAWLFQNVDKILRRLQQSVDSQPVNSCESLASQKVQELAIMSRPSNAAFVPRWSETVVMTKENWTPCSDTRGCSSFTRDPKAAGWHEDEWMTDDDGNPEWECEASWRRQFDDANFKCNKRGCSISIGNDEQFPYEFKLTVAKVNKLAADKTLPPLEQKMYKWIKEKVDKAGYGYGTCFPMEYFDIAKRLCNFKEFGPLPEVLKV